MKTINLLKIMTCALLLSSEVGAQTIYDAAKFSGKDLNGTARFVGMGGAMGALGGDISTISTNPAGIGIYRSNDLMTTFGFNYTSSESNYKGNIMKSDKYRGSFDNIGFVYSSKIGNQTALRYVNFGFNYHKAKSFNRDFAMGGDLSFAYNGGTRWISQTDQMALSSRDLSTSEMSLNNLDVNARAGWLSILGWNGCIIHQDPASTNQYIGFPANDPSGSYSSRERGGIDAYDFNLSFNISNRVYLGFTLGAYDVNYTKNTMYSEYFPSSINPLDQNGNELPFFLNNSDYSYSLESFMKTTGTGVDFKAGIILRPVEESPLRIGAAIHTPTFYNLTMHNSAILTSNADVDAQKHITPVKTYSLDTYNEIGGDVVTDYQLTTPWKYNLSLGYTIGSNVALGAEYEYQDYSTAKLSYGDGTRMSVENGMMKDFLKGVSTLRLGAEIKLVPEFSIRAGYNHSAGAFTNDAFKDLPLNSVRTDTDYSNDKSINNYTLGLGYRAGSFYADIAYQYSAYKEDFYPFDNLDLTKTSVNNDKQQVLLTLGFRF